MHDVTECCEFIYVAPLLCSKDTLSLCPSCTSGFHCFFPLFLNDPSTFGEGGVVIFVTFRTGHFSVFYSLHLDQLLFSVLVIIYCKQTLLLQGFRDAIIYGYKKALRVGLIQCPFSIIIVVGSFQRSIV